MLYNFLYLANHDTHYLHMYLYPEEDVHVDEKEEDDDKMRT